MKKELLFLGFLCIAVFASAQNTCNGHEYVDLGLSVKWATCNIGANSPEEYGDYFACGETEPKSFFDWSTYKWCNGSFDTQTKYNNSSFYGKVDNKTTLDASDDAAHVNWGGQWRMPTQEEFLELTQACTWERCQVNGIYGSKIKGPNGNTIFLPAAGYRDDNQLKDANEHGNYWSSTIPTDEMRDSPNICAYYLAVPERNCWYYSGRFFGQSIRPVLP